MVIKTIAKAIYGTVLALALTSACSPTVNRCRPVNGVYVTTRGMSYTLSGGYETSRSALGYILTLAALIDNKVEIDFKGETTLEVMISGKYDITSVSKESLQKAARLADSNRNNWVSVTEAKLALEEYVEQASCDSVK